MVLRLSNGWVMNKPLHKLMPFDCKMTEYKCIEIVHQYFFPYECRSIAKEAIKNKN